jgi:hypothetical protein
MKGKLIALWQFFWNSNYYWGAIVLAGALVALLTFRISDPQQQESVLAALKDSPIPTILVIAGIVFLLLSVTGQLAGRIAVAPEQQRWAAMIGGGGLAIGIALHVVPQTRLISPRTEKAPTTQPPMPAPPAQAVPEAKEPNNDMTTAPVITEGSTVRGSLATDQDQDLFKVTPSGDKTRVLVRVHSPSHFMPLVTVYDQAEKMLAIYPASAFQPATLSFESVPGSTYYIVVRPPGSGQHGSYELEVRKE